MLHVLKGVSKNMTIMREELENINKNQMGLLGMRNIVSEMKFLWIKLTDMTLQKKQFI